jgi:hypothetical protein
MKWCLMNYAQQQLHFYLVFVVVVDDDEDDYDGTKGHILLVGIVDPELPWKHLLWYEDECHLKQN